METILSLIPATLLVSKKIILVSSDKFDNWNSLVLVLKVLTKKLSVLLLLNLLGSFGIFFNSSPAK